MAEKIAPQVQAIWDALESDAGLAMSKATSAESAEKDPAILLQIKEAIVSIELQQGSFEAAGSSAEAMLAICKGKDAKGEAKALICSAQVASAKGDMVEALKKADEAFAACKEKDSQTSALRAKMSIYIANWKYSEAKDEALKAVAVFQEAGDAEGEASAQLMVAEACLSYNSHKEASAAAMSALALYKASGDTSGQGAALMAIITAEMEDVKGSAVQAAQERLALFKAKGDAMETASSNLALAGAYVARLVKKMGSCSLASAEDSLGALNAAMAAYDGFKGENNWEGQDACMREVSRTLGYNLVPGEMIESLRDPHEAYEQVMAGAFSNSKNALPSKTVVTSKNAKIEDIIPSAKQLEKGKFAWTRPLDGYYYTLIWMPAKDREAKRKPRGSYDVLSTMSGSASQVTNPDFMVKAHDSAERGKPLALFMYSPDCYLNYATSFMALMNTYAAMATSNLKFITTVHINESHQDMATAADNRMRCCGIYNASTGIIRSARIELPTIESGFVSGDIASWMSDPMPIIENIFDTVEGDEGEFMYKRNEAFAPLLVHRPPEEEIVYVKPKKANRL